MARLTLDLHIAERDALIRLAAREKRDVRDQAVLLLRYALIGEGVLPPESPVLLASQPKRAVEVGREPR